MKVETMTTDSCQERVLLVFEPGAQSEMDKVSEYLSANDLAPRRTYTEARDGGDHEIYYFGSCYIGGHLDALEEMTG